MLLIPCPWCGPRDETEFHYGGQAGVAYPTDPAALTDAEWAELPVHAGQPQGPVRASAGATRAGCRRWFTVVGTRSPTRSSTADPATGDRPMTRRDSPGCRSVVASTGLGRCAFRFDGRELTGAPRRHARLGPAGQRRARSSARSVHRAARAASSPPGPRSRTRSSRSTAADREPMVRATTRGALRRPGRRGRCAGKGRLAGRAGPGALRQALDALRRAGGRRRPGRAGRRARRRPDGRPGDPRRRPAELGGALLAERPLDGRRWTGSPTTAAELAALPEVRVLARTTVDRLYDHNFLVAVRAAHRAPRRCGAGARGAATALAHPGRPASSSPPARTSGRSPSPTTTGRASCSPGPPAGYLHRYGVRPGRRAVVFGAHDCALRGGRDLLDAGLEVAAVLDSAPGTAPGRSIDALRAARGAGPDRVASSARRRPEPACYARTWRLLDGRSDVGRRRRSSATSSPSPAAGTPRAPVQPGRWRARLRSDAGRRAFVPRHGTVGRAVRRGRRRQRTSTGRGAPRSGRRSEAPTGARVPAGDAGHRADPLWLRRAGGPADGPDLRRPATGRHRRRPAPGRGAGMRSVEHVKRYTTAGTGARPGQDLGRRRAPACIADALGRPTSASSARPRSGRRTRRSPSPPSPGVTGARCTTRSGPPPIHDWHVAHGAVFENVGQWKRPWYYPQAGEDMDAAVLRECRAAREGVAIMDASTLGKIDVQGPDAGEFLDRIYTNMFSHAGGRARAATA